MNTFPDFNSGNVFALSFVLKELVEDSFELLDEFNLFKILLEFVDSHGGNGDNFFFSNWEPGHVLMILAVVHSVEPLEEFGQFITNMIKAEDVDLEVWPYFIEGGDKVMGVFGHFVDGSETGLDVELYEGLNILSDELVDEYLVSSGGLLCWQFKDEST